MQTITLRHGDGGRQTSRLIHDVFYHHFGQHATNGCLDAALLNVKQGRLAFTTDSFVVRPLFFPGGNIGSLAVCGTVNDLAAAGAIPLALSAGFIIEEGFDGERLEVIAATMQAVCQKSGVNIVTGDTKVVEKGLIGGVFINTAGVGTVHSAFKPQAIRDGDAIILTGSIAEHGTVILSERFSLDVQDGFKSDCAPLDGIITVLDALLAYVRLMRDPTRGGVATALCEIAEGAHIGAVVQEDCLPIRPQVAALHQMLGTDPLYFACEGRMLLVVDSEQADAILSRLKTHESCRDAVVIGTFDSARERVWLRNPLGGEHLLSVLENHMIPRIC